MCIQCSIIGKYGCFRNCGSAVFFCKPTVKAVIPTICFRHNGKCSVRSGVDAFCFAASAVWIKCNNKTVRFPIKYRESAVFICNISYKEFSVCITVKLRNKRAALHFGFGFHCGAVRLECGGKRTKIKTSALYGNIFVAAKASDCAAAVDGFAYFSCVIAALGHGSHIYISRNAAYIIAAGHRAHIIAGKQLCIVLVIAHYAADIFCGSAAYCSGIFTITDVSVGVCAGNSADLFRAGYRGTVCAALDFIVKSYAADYTADLNCAAYASGKRAIRYGSSAFFIIHCARNTAGLADIAGGGHASRKVKPADLSAAEYKPEEAGFTFGGSKLQISDIFAVAVKASRKGVPASSDGVPVFRSKRYIVKQLCRNCIVPAVYFTCKPV